MRHISIIIFTFVSLIIQKTMKLLLNDTHHILQIISGDLFSAIEYRFADNLTFRVRRPRKPRA